jgi:two-component system, response regulator PdtaR
MAKAPNCKTNWGGSRQFSGVRLLPAGFGGWRDAWALRMAVILIVDDEIMVIRFARLALEQAEHTVHTADSGMEAWRLANETKRFDVLIVDHWIPPDTGRAIAERVLGTHPKAKVMHISGYPREHLEEHGWFLPGAAFLGKPFRMREIQESVELCLRLTFKLKPAWRSTYALGVPCAGLEDAE